MALQRGSEGYAVTNLQKNLLQIGITPLVDDGIFGPQTESAVKTFQLAHGLKADGVVDALTQDQITKALVGQIVMPVDGPVPWLAWMKKHIGEVEQSGGKVTPFDKEVFSHTSYGPLDGAMVAGCAATACAALEETGYKSPHNAAAESFRNFGVPCELKPGALVGFNWAGKKGVHADHITFCDHIVDDKQVACLGGNQSHQVQVSLYSREFIDFVVWPHETLGVKVAPVVVSQPAPVEVKPKLAWEVAPEGAKWSNDVRALIAASNLPDVSVSDGETFWSGFSKLSREQRVEFWAQLISKITEFECGFDPHEASVDVGVKNDKDTWSAGLLQLSVTDQANYKLPLGYKYDDLLVPEKNLTLGVKIMNALVLQDRRIAGRNDAGHWQGLARYWSTIRTGEDSFAKIVAYVRRVKL